MDSPPQGEGLAFKEDKPSPFTDDQVSRRRTIIPHSSSLSYPYYMEYQFPDNTNNTNITYMRTRTGPNFFRVFYKQGCCIRFTPKEVGAVFGVARFTPTVNNIREWCYEMVKEYGSEEDKSDDGYLNYIAKHGFGPEVHEEPNDNTKMVI